METQKEKREIKKGKYEKKDATKKDMADSLQNEQDHHVRGHEIVVGVGYSRPPDTDIKGDDDANPLINIPLTTPVTIGAIVTNSVLIADRTYSKESGTD